MPVDLLTEELDLTPKCEAALGEIFDRYDLDKDGALNNAELTAFAQFTNGKPFAESELADIRMYLQCRQTDQALLREGFIQLYSLQIGAGDLDETWRDLHKHGYDDQLELKKAEEKPAPDGPVAKE
ncbi:hypothetical protein GGF46_004203 [Coemansia sp. RSA 552]|nr:hypothetical protein GGF46_004203 [Coemansia sp. RSA 552]